MADPLNPSTSLLCKLGSLLVHIEEMLEPDGHEFDLRSVRALVGDTEVGEWRKAMDAMALLPKKRGE